MKQQKIKKESIGLGDTIEKITEKTGIKKAVKFAFGKDCGCEERKKLLNKIFPYVNCLTQKEYQYLKKWYDSKQQSINVTRRRELLDIYNRVFNKKRKDTSCGSCVRDINDSLKRVYDQYLTK
jgi:hypothetical protein